MTEHHEAIADSFDVEQPYDPEWYKRAVFYEVLIRGFQDSDGNGTGDLSRIKGRWHHGRARRDQRAARLCQPQAA